MYAGVSLPVESISHLNTAYVQANYAVNLASRLRSHQWYVAFEDCAL